MPVDDEFFEQLKEETEGLRSKNIQLNTALSTAAYQGQEESNLIQFQVETAEMLNKFEHFLKGEYITIDEDGNEYWAKPMKKVLDENDKPIPILTSNGRPKKDHNGNILYEMEVDQSKVFFNDFGVNAILSILGNYLDKNTILSRYDEMRINEMLADFGTELAIFIYCNYEKMGMDTDFKKSKYNVIVLNIVHTVESVFRRALHGKTLEDLNSSRIFTQMENVGRIPTQITKKRFNPFKPKTW